MALTTITIPLPFYSAHSLRNIQHIDSHYLRSRAVAEPPDCIRELLGIARNPTLAKIAYEENVAPDDFINLVQPISIVSTRNDYARFTCLLRIIHKTG
jgi:hypothetical protein